MNTPDALAGLLANSDPYLSCDDCFARLDEYVEQLARDPSHQDLALQTHLGACSACHEEAASLLELVTAG